VPFSSSAAFPTCTWRWANLLASTPYTIPVSSDTGAQPCATPYAFTGKLRITVDVDATGTVSVGVVSTNSGGGNSTNPTWTSTDCGATWSNGQFCDLSATGVPTITIAFV
jgi:hypothetical protein